MCGSNTGIARNAAMSGYHVHHHFTGNTYQTSPYKASNTSPGDNLTSHFLQYDERTSDPCHTSYIQRPVITATSASGE